MRVGFDWPQCRVCNALVRSCLDSDRVRAWRDEWTTVTIYLRRQGCDVCKCVFSVLLFFMNHLYANKRSAALSRFVSLYSAAIFTHSSSSSCRILRASSIDIRARPLTAPSPPERRATLAKHCGGLKTSKTRLIRYSALLPVHKHRRSIHCVQIGERVRIEPIAVVVDFVLVTTRRRIVARELAAEEIARTL